MEMGEDFVCELSEMNEFKYLGSVVFIKNDIKIGLCASGILCDKTTRGCR